MIEAVIFDLDGTLIHLPIDYEKLFQEFSKIMNTADIHPLSQKIPKLNGRTKRKIFEVWNKAELEVSANVSRKDEGFDIYERFFEKRKALVTMQGKALVKDVLGRLGLSFDFVVTREHSLNRVEQLKIVAERFAVSYKNILFVGNIDDDSLAAKEVGCQFLRVKNEDLV